MFTVDGFFYTAWFSDGLSLKSEISPRMLLEMNISSSHWVQNTSFHQTLCDGTWTRGVGSEVKFPPTEGGSVNKENPATNVSCCYSDFIDFEVFCLLLS